MLARYKFLGFAQSAEFAGEHPENADKNSNVAKKSAHAFDIIFISLILLTAIYNSGLLTKMCEALTAKRPMLPFAVDDEVLRLRAATRRHRLRLSSARRLEASMLCSSSFSRKASLCGNPKRYSPSLRRRINSCLDFQVRMCEARYRQKAVIAFCRKRRVTERTDVLFL